MKKAFPFLAFAILLAAAPLRAAELPSFCVNPTPQEKANTELQNECKILVELDKGIETLKSTLQTVHSVLDGAKKADDELQRQLKTLLPPPRERPGEHIPSSPNEVRH